MLPQFTFRLISPCTGIIQTPLEPKTLKSTQGRLAENIVGILGQQRVPMLNSPETVRMPKLDKQRLLLTLICMMDKYIVNSILVALQGHSISKFLITLLYDPSYSHYPEIVENPALWASRANWSPRTLRAVTIMSTESVPVKERVIRYDNVLLDPVAAILMIFLCSSCAWQSLIQKLHGCFPSMSLVLEQMSSSDSIVESASKFHINKMQVATQIWKTCLTCFSCAEW